MNKEELCHIHALLHEVHDYFEWTYNTTIDLDEYTALDSTPISCEAAFLRKKETVETAVFALLNDLTQNVPTEPEQSTVEADSGVRSRQAREEVIAQ